MKKTTGTKLKSVIAAGICFVFAVMCIAGCSLSPAQAQETGAQDTASRALAETSAETVSTAVQTGDYDSEDTDSSYDAGSAQSITLNGDSIEADSAAVTVDGSTATITNAGVYTVSGTLANGQIIVNAGDNDTVQLVLDGMDITCETSAPVYVENADKVILTLADGSQNTVTDGENYVFPDSATDEPNAAIFSKDDLTLNGTGTLTVNANYNNGIGGKDDLVITGGTYIVNVVNHAIRGRDSVSVQDGDFTLEAGADGIQSNNDEDTEKGYIIIDGGTFNITAANDAIQAETSLTVNGGDFTIETGGGYTNAEERAGEMFGGGNMQQRTTETTDDETTGSYKGIKAGTDIAITNGTLKIDSADDSVHANGNIAISGGNLTLASGDDGIHADGDLTVSDGDIDITASYEGMEASTMTIAGGTINIVATDDGINISGGNDGNEGPFGGDGFASQADSGRWLIISGGTINIDAGSDGIDINGTGEMTAGEVTVSAGTISPDGTAIDSDGTFNEAGGTLEIITEGSMGNMGGGNTGGGRGPGGRQ